MSAKKRKNGARRQRCDPEASPRHRINLPLTKLLKRPRAFASIGVMSTTLIETRPARPDDAVCLAETHDEAWRTAYQGLIPGPELEKLITRRGPSWWDTAIRRGSRISLLIFGDEIAGYANYGRNRAKSLPYAGEVYELYLRPEYQGLGFGRRCFRTPSAISPSRDRPAWSSGCFPTTSRPSPSIARSAAGPSPARPSASARRCSTSSPSPGRANA